MSGFNGADVAQLRSAGYRFTASASDLQTMVAALTQRIADPTFWRGADAERFRAEWMSVSVPAVKAVILGLQDAGTSLLRNADEQDQASSGGAGAANSAEPSATPSTVGVGGSGFTVSPQTLSSLGVAALGLASEPLGDLFSAVGLAEAGTDLWQHATSGDALRALNDTTTIASDLFKEAPPGSAPHLFGQAAGIWQFVGEQAAMTDLSAEGLRTVTDFVLTDPVGAAIGAGEGIVGGLPGILGAVL